MKIMYCVFDCSNFGGTERALCMQANYFARQGNDVTIVTTELPMRSDLAYEFSDKIHFVNLDIRYAEVDGSMSPAKIVKRILKGWSHTQKLSRLVKNMQPDVLVSFFSHEMTLLNKVRGNAATVVEMHFTKLYRNIDGQIQKKGFWSRKYMLLKEWRKNRCISQYDAFVVLTQKDALNWKDLSNIHVIPNALPFIPESTSSLSQKRVLSVGRLSAEKGYIQLLSAWRYVYERHPEWVLEIYGEGDEYDNLIQFIRENQLDQVCFIKSPVQNIKEKYQESSIFVLSSLYEGFGIVLIEAMACGVPCVSYDCPCGPSDIIQHGENGFLVPTGNEKMLADYICELIENPEKRVCMGNKAFSSVKRFTEDRVMKEWEKLFVQLVGEK